MLKVPVMSAFVPENNILEVGVEPLPPAPIMAVVAVILTPLLVLEWVVKVRLLISGVPDAYPNMRLSFSLVMVFH